MEELLLLIFNFFLRSHIRCASESHFSCVMYMNDVANGSQNNIFSDNLCVQCTEKSFDCESLSLCSMLSLLVEAHSEEKIF